MKDISRQEAQDLREMARLAFRNSVGATEDDAVSFNYRDYSTLDLNFLWHFKMMIEAKEREACARVCETWGDKFDVRPVNLAKNCAATIRARGES